MSQASLRIGAVLAVSIAGLAAGFVLTGWHLAPGTVTRRAGPITLTVSPLRANANGQLTSELTLTNRGDVSDELDTALAAGGTPVSLAHNPAGGPVALDVCGGAVAFANESERWMHDGPLWVSNPFISHGLPVRATMLLTAPRNLRSGEALSITFYFARAGAVTVEVPTLDERA